MAKRSRRVEIFAGKQGKFYFHVRAANGEITQASQGYASRQGARRAARREYGTTLPLVTIRGQGAR